MKSIVKTLSLATAIAALPTFLCAQVVVQDTFNISTTGLTANLDFEQAARQSGGLVTTGYQTWARGIITSAHADNGAIEDIHINGDTGSLMMRNTGSLNYEVSTSIRLDDLGAHLAGNIYHIRYTAEIDRPVGASNVNWFAFALSDDGSLQGAPNAAQNQFGMLLRSTGAGNLFNQNNALISLAAGTTGIEPSVTYTVDIIIDETGSAPIASVVINQGTAGEYAFDSYSFANFTDDERYLYFRSSVAGAGGSGTLNFHLYDYSVTVIPEPATFALFLGLIGLVGIVLRRKRKS
jgi:hypothetical protein